MSVATFVWIIGFMFTAGLYFHKTTYKAYVCNLILGIKIALWWPFYLGQELSKYLSTTKER